MSKMSGFAAGVMVLTLFAGFASASTIDQQNTVVTSYLGPSSNPGESFTPTLNGIDFATFELAVSPGGAAVVFAALYQGAGYGGSLIALSGNDVLVSDSSFSPYTFGFSHTVALTPGSTYTLSLIDAEQNLFEEEGNGNPYAGGVEYDSAGIAQTDYDLAFSEGTNTTPAETPEPAPFLMLFTAMLVLGGRPAWRALQNQA